jgi:tRNA G37 N-methylase TrmD
MLPKLDYWKNYKNLDGAKKFEDFKHKLMEEINALNIDGMPKVENLMLLCGRYINLDYRLPNGKNRKIS